MNHPGVNDIGSDHAAGSRPILPPRKFKVVACFPVPDLGYERQERRSLLAVARGQEGGASMTGNLGTSAWRGSEASVLKLGDDVLAEAHLGEDGLHSEVKALASRDARPHEVPEHASEGVAEQEEAGRVQHAGGHVAMDSTPVGPVRHMRMVLGLGTEVIGRSRNAALCCSRAQRAPWRARASTGAASCCSVAAMASSLWLQPMRKEWFIFYEKNKCEGLNKK